MTPELLLLAGRSGVGKTSVAYEVSAQLAAARVAHVHLEGDALSSVYPKPADDPHGTRLTLANLSAVWANYRSAGQHRLLYVNAVSVLEADALAAALGTGVSVRLVELTGEDATVAARLGAREIGGGLDQHLASSARVAGLLAAQAPSGTVRIATDRRGVPEIATDVVRASGWATADGERSMG